MPHRQRRFTFPIVAVAAMLFLSAGDCLAHAFPVAQHPAAGEVLDSAPAEVVIRFDRLIEDAFSHLRVEDTAGKTWSAGRGRVDDDQRTLRVKLRRIPPGAYHVIWTVVSRDGHRTQGDYDFIYKGPE